MATTSRTTPAARSKSTSTGRSKAAAAPKVEDKPTFHFSIKQAMAEREAAPAEEQVEPYTVEGVNGETITFRVPGEIGWQESAALTMRDPFTAVRTMLEDDQYELFLAQGDFPNEILRDLVQEWMGHHGVIPAGN